MFNYIWRVNKYCFGCFQTLPTIVSQNLDHHCLTCEIFEFERIKNGDKNRFGSTIRRFFHAISLNHSYFKILILILKQFLCIYLEIKVIKSHIQNRGESIVKCSIWIEGYHLLSSDERHSSNMTHGYSKKRDISELFNT